MPCQIYSLISAFFVAMALNPDVQAQARTELDAVVGPDRLPDFSDRAALPYVNAILKEVMRWHVSVPLAFPHLSTADDEYGGYFIPRGSMVMMNSWFVVFSCLDDSDDRCVNGKYRSILHDPEVYPEPERFMPERFLKDGKLDPRVQDPMDVAFGLGRR